MYSTLYQIDILKEIELEIQKFMNIKNIHLIQLHQ